MATVDHVRQFASDNYAGICPEAVEAMMMANTGHTPSYGEDPWTQRACDALRELFEIDLQAFFVFTGTAANSLALAALCQSYNSIIIAESAHVETDECGAPEFFSNGTKLLKVTGPDGKCDPQQVEETILRRNDIHYPKPHALSLTQATEVGTVYSLDELAELSHVARKYHLHVHMDGSRLANALVTLGCKPKEVTWQMGVDVLCFGGAKNGLGIGEVVVFFNTDLANEFDYRCKQAGQLDSKMRFLAAPWTKFLEDGIWLKNAAHANEMAALLEKRLFEVAHVKPCYPRQANAVFVKLPQHVLDGFAGRGWHVYSFIGGAARLMCSWDIQPQDIEDLVADIADMLAKGPEAEEASQD